MRSACSFVATPAARAHRPVGVAIFVNSPVDAFILKKSFRLPTIIFPVRAAFKSASSLWYFFHLLVFCPGLLV